MNRLEALGLRERTLLVYVVDNGWEAGASGGSHLYQHGGPKGKQSLYEVGFRTPVLFNWPGHVPAGVVRDDLVSTVDLFPTLLAYAGALRPAGAFGQDLRPAIDEGNPVPRDAIVGHMAEIRGDAPGGTVPSAGRRAAAATSFAPRAGTTWDMKSVRSSSTTWWRILKKSTTSPRSAPTWCARCEGGASAG